eukprot:TRINITY_DN62464_c0_g1_i1.p1 TRINITY_DN62464_c0_g1~~TRINITY_DN62464_c0_g1_i1.p1  ORF type:complete len:220 (+),score=60.79 TRINITY_DN62464_c0_g1_i1:67-726(+)
MAGSDVSALFRKAEQLKREIDSVLESFAAPKDKRGSDIALQQRLAALFSDLTASSQHIREEVSSMSDERSRISWDRKASKIEEDVAVIEKAVEKQIGAVYKLKKQEEDRKKLFGDRKKNDGPADDEQALAREHSSLAASNNALDDVLEQANAIFGNLVGQNTVLKNARRKLLDAANVMGVSQSLVNVIDRRQTGDKWLVYGGMALTLFILFSLWYLLRR